MFLIENVCKRSKIQKHKTINFLCNAFQYNTIYSVATIRFEPGEYCELAKNVSCLCRKISRKFTLQWRHNGRDSVLNHQPGDCLLNRLFRRRSKKTSKLRVTGLCVGNSPGTGEFPHKWPVTRKMLPFDDVIMLKLGVTDDWKSPPKFCSEYDQAPGVQLNITLGCSWYAPRNGRKVISNHSADSTGTMCSREIREWSSIGFSVSGPDKHTT